MGFSKSKFARKKKWGVMGVRNEVLGGTGVVC